uniref:ubiquitinyl hydrolase 1 n=1 Tax=Strongyloides venezuelensis TaxID=75913 RepID=A0A0K0F761_STRVS
MYCERLDNIMGRKKGKRLPNILILRIEQLYLSPNTGEMMKAKQKITFPKILDIRNFCYTYDKSNDYNNSLLNSSPIPNNSVINNVHRNEKNISNNMSLITNSNGEAFCKLNLISSSSTLYNNSLGVGSFKDEYIMSKISEKYSSIVRYKYKLKAVCQHIGNHSSGHFITVRKELFFDNEKELKISEIDDYNELSNPHQFISNSQAQTSNNYLNEWYRVSDNSVSHVDEEFLDNCQPYLLVYDKMSFAESSY